MIAVPLRLRAVLPPTIPLQVRSELVIVVAPLSERSAISDFVTLITLPETLSELSPQRAVTPAQSTSTLLLEMLRELLPVIPSEPVVAVSSIVVLTSTSLFWMVTSLARIPYFPVLMESSHPLILIEFLARIP